MKLHKNARTTPRIRQEIQGSVESHVTLAKRYNIGVATVRKWRKRDHVEDSPTRPDIVHSSIMPMQELWILGLRQLLYLSIDDLLGVSSVIMDRCPSRAAIARLLKRHHLSQMRNILPFFLDERCPLSFKQSMPGTVQIQAIKLSSSADGQSMMVYLALERSGRCFASRCFSDVRVSHIHAVLGALQQTVQINIVRILLAQDLYDLHAGKPRSIFSKRCKKEGVEVVPVQFVPLAFVPLLQSLPGGVLADVADVMSDISDVYHDVIPLKSLAGKVPASVCVHTGQSDEKRDNRLTQIKNIKVVISKQINYVDHVIMPPYVLGSKTNNKWRKRKMSNANDVINELMGVEGAIAAVIADSDSGMVLAAKSNGFDTDTAAAGNTRVMQAKRDTMKMLGLNDNIDDILITLGTQIHLIRPLPSNDAIFGYLVVSKSGANLGMARAQLKKAMASLAI